MTARLQLRWTVVPWFRPRLRVPPVPGEAFRIERVIAAARLLLTLVTFIQLDRTLLFPREYIFQAEVFLITFAVYGLTAMAVLRTRQRTTRAFALTTHAIDLVAAVAMFPVAAPPSPFFVLFLFVLAAAAFRWGLRETFATNLVAVALVFIHAALTAWWPPLNFGIPYDLNRILLRAAYLSMIGLFLGYLAEESRLLRSETVAIAGILGRVRADAGATRVLTAIAAEVESLFNAKKPAAGRRESIDRSGVPLGFDHRVADGAGDDAGRCPRRRRASLPVRIAERDACSRRGSSGAA